MISPDVNVLVYALRSDLPDHERYRDWLQGVVNGQTQYALSELALAGLIRVSTNPRVFKIPTPLDRAVDFADGLRSPVTAVVVSPGPRHWRLFTDLCRAVNATGNLVPDAYFAALAIEHDLEWITTDRDYAKFPGLRFRHPLA
jgi:uncharacterized protein